MNWTQPSWLYATLLVLPLLFVVAVTGWWHRRRLAAVFGPELLDRVVPPSVRSRRTVRDLGALLCLVFGCLALAEPSFDKEIVKVKAKGVDLVLALDLSRSMDARDVDPSRLERARREIVDLLSVLEGDRVAVVLFAGQAIARLPLTHDLKAVQWVFDDVSTELFRAQGSDLGAALDVSRELLSRDEGKAGKAVVVFSDGETHDPENAMRAANDAYAAGIAVYAVGIGDAAVEIPTPQGGVLRYKGQPVISTPDFTTLQEVARATGGAYVKSEASAADMEGLYRSGIRAQVRAVERDAQQTEKWRSAFQIPLGIGFGLWLFGAWLGEGRRAFGAAGALLALSLASGPAQAAPGVSTPAEADALYRSEDYRGAARAFEALVLERPGSSDLYSRLGAARYRAGEWLGAAQAYEQASRLAGGDADADFAAANARWRAGQLEQALQGYERALATDPSHAPAQTNRDLVSGELQTRRVPKPPPPPEGGGGDDEEEKDGGQGDPSPEPTPGEQGENPDAAPPSGENPEQGPQDTPPQDGQPGEGDPGEGTSDAPPADGQPSDGPPSDATGEPSEQDGNSDAVEPSDVQGEPSEEPGEQGTSAEGSMGEATGNTTPAQAARMLDGVEEGRPRTTMVGRSSDKPW